MHTIPRRAHAVEADALEHAADAETRALVHQVGLLAVCGALPVLAGAGGGLPDLVAHEARHQDAQLLQWDLPACAGALWATAKRRV